MDVEKDQFRDKIKILYENMLCFEGKQFIIIIFNGDMKYCYDFVRFFMYGEEDIMFINFFNKLIKDD